MDNVINVNFGKFNIFRTSRTQFDKGQIFKFSEPIPDGTEVQYSDGSVKVVNNQQCSIPDKMLLTAGIIKAYIQVITTDSQTTIKTIEVNVVGRTKPNDYADPEDEPTFREYVEKVLTDTKAVADSVRADADAGRFNGQDYVLTVDDKKEIAEIVKSECIDELETMIDESGAIDVEP